eukprot:Em0015g589a
MADEDSLENVEQALEEQYDADSPLDCEQNCRTANSDFVCDKSSKDMATLFTNSVELEWMVVPNIQPNIQISASEVNHGAIKDQSLRSEMMLLPRNTSKSGYIGSSTNDTNSVLPVKQHHLYAPPDDITARAQRIGITLKEVYVSAHTIIGVVLLQPQKEAVKVMVQWSNDDWATFHDTQADLITCGAHDDMELFRFDISAEKTLHIHLALYYCTYHS